MTSPPLKALIIGGGVAGPCAAHWLYKLGAQVVLIERASKMRASGQQVDLRGHGVPMMKKMGILDAVLDVRVKEAGMQFIDVSGKTKAYFPAVNDGSERQSFTSDYEIMRGDLVKLLYKLTEGKEGVEHRYGTWVEKFEEEDPEGKVKVTFQNGVVEEFDLVIGADGTGSRTRKMMLGPGAPDPRHRVGGGYIGFFSVKAKEGDSDRFTMCHLPGSKTGRVIITRKDCPDLTRVYLMTNGVDPKLDETLKTGDLAAQKQAWSDIFAGGGWECDRFMEQLRTSPEADDLYWTPMQQVRLPPGTWSKGKVVLLGDSAWSGTANGFGCAHSLVGAYMLMGEIQTLLNEGVGTSKAVIEGAKKFEEKFRPTATAGFGDRDWAGSLFYPRTKMTIGILHGIVSMVSALKLDRMMGSMLSTGWQAPSYPAMAHVEADKA